MLPELLRIPIIEVPIYTYGLMITIGLITAVTVTTWLADKEGIPKNKIYDLAIYLFPLALLGTRLLMIIAGWREILSDWRQVLVFDLLNSVGFYLGGFLTALAVSSGEIPAGQADDRSRGIHQSSDRQAGFRGRAEPGDVAP